MPALSLQLQRANRFVRSDQARRLWEAVALPLGLILAAELLMLLMATTQNGRPLQATTWARWDSKYYLQIATRGYYLAPCDGNEGPLGATCGDAAWFPLIGWLTGAIAWIGVSPSAAMLLLVRLFAFGTLVLVWNGLLDRRRDPASLAAMVFVAFAPGSVYFHALFPISVATFFMTATWVLLRHRRFLLAAGALGLAATTYTTVALMAPAAFVWVLIGSGGGRLTRLRRAGVLAACAVAGAAVVVAVMWTQTGELNAFSQVQEKYMYAKDFPTRMLFDRIGSIREGTGIGPVLGGQALYVALLMLVSVAWWLRRRTRGIELGILLMALTLWVVPLYLGQSSLQRGDALLVPMAYLIARMHRTLALGIAVVAVALAGPLAAFYVQGGLI